MSYEGYEQHLCKKGHLFCVDAMVFIGLDEEDVQKCPYCSESSVFFNSVDETNGEQWGVITEDAWETLLLTPEIRKTCNLGCEHIIEQAIYRKPRKQELESLRHYYDSDADKFKLCSGRS